MTTPTQILDDFARNSWDSKPFEKMLELARADPTEAFRLLELAIERGGESATFLDAAVGFVPDNMLADLGPLAANAFLEDPENEVAESVIAYLSMQAADCLQPFLLPFNSNEMPNADTYYQSWPWRGASDADLAQMLSLLQSATDSEERAANFRCILESRNNEYIAAALAAINEGDLPYDAIDYLAEVGFDSKLRPLFSETAFHIRFSEEYLSHLSVPCWARPMNFPTWSLPAREGKHRFGGLAEGTCGICDGPLHHLITLDPVPDGITLDVPPHLQLATCLSCCSWSKPVLFFQHDEAGRPFPLDRERITPEFPAEPLLETWVELSPTPPRWRRQDWALANGRENLHRFGGHPSWIQSAEYQHCPKCERPMPLLLQLDSSLPTINGGELMWGSGGIGYVFWCGECKTSATISQCT